MIKLLVGNIASGKSTYCQKYAKEGWIIINDDAVVNAVHNGDYTLYNESLKPLYKSIEDHMLHTAIAMGKSVCIDRGVDVCRTSRIRWIGMAHSLDTPINAVIFDTFAPEIHAQRRVNADARGLSYDIWLEVAQKMAKSYIPPSIEEGFDGIEYHHFDNN